MLWRSCAEHRGFYDAAGSMHALQRGHHDTICAKLLTLPNRNRSFTRVGASVIISSRHALRRSRHRFVMSCVVIR